MWETVDVNDPGRNDIGAALIEPNVWEEFLQHAASHDFNVNEAPGETGFKPDLDHSSFDPFNNDQFDAFHFSDLGHSNAADWVNVDDEFLQK